MSETVQKIFPSNFHFIPNHPQKTRLFYEYILVETDSIEIIHTKNKEDPTKIAFLKIKILRVLTSTKWNQSIYTEKRFSHQFLPQTYSYIDYQQAWYNVFWLNNFNHF